MTTKCNKCGRFLDGDMPYIELAGVEPCRWCLACFYEVHEQVVQAAKGLSSLATTIPKLKAWRKKT